MPHIKHAMERSVRVKVADIVFDALLGRRDVTDNITNVKNSFSSWDNCMNASYCNTANVFRGWPVIVGIIVGGLIILSIATCIIRCACCGASCCCACFSFLKCCDCCGDSCAGKKNKPHKHLDDPYAARNLPGNQGYQAPAPMMGGALPAKVEPPQYAQFEVGRNGLAVEPKSTLHEDALPPMPSWDSASKKHVEDEEEKNAVELGHLDPATGQSMPLMTGAAVSTNNLAASPRDMRNPYGQQPGQAINGNGYAGVPNDSYSPQLGANGFNGNGGYRGSPSPGPGRGQGYGPPRGTSAQGRGYGPSSPQDGYGNDQFGAAAIGNGYARPPPQRQFSNGPNGRPFPPQPARQYSSDSSRPLNPARQYSEQSYESQPYDNFQGQNPPPRGPSRGPSRGPPPNGMGPPPNRMQSPIINNAGFDFGAGAEQPYSRPTPPPQQQSYNSSQSGRRPNQPPMRQGSRDNYGPPVRQGSRDNYGPPARQGSRDEYSTYDGTTAPPSYASRSPPPQEPAYPGYKPYTPPVQIPRSVVRPRLLP
ncbi:hypothetical protein LSUE1_G002786 [Lachnellula suecica]|uniref:Fibroin-3 related protein n=1 Tax=Lachnellula suecica TaxID=602035 RepID=A0A8T9CHK6_9HELO|nr:hypothetical protein LSUE1_G002786 [Lachnellula suecica]